MIGRGTAFLFTLMASAAASIDSICEKPTSVSLDLQPGDRLRLLVENLGRGGLLLT